MPRDIPVGNGSLLVNFDQAYQMRDLYWPHVGKENHTEGHACRFGVWVDGRFRWVSDEGWSRTLAYEDDTLVTQVKLHNPALDLRMTCQDTVDFHENLYLRQIVVENQEEREREIRLFFTHDFHISGQEVGDSAYYESERRAVFHYKGQRWFLINVAKTEMDHWSLGLDQWAVGIKEAQGREGTWRDAEDGHLSGNAVAQGSVDSTVALHLVVPAHGRTMGWYWIAVGADFREVTRINRAVRQKGPQTFLDRTRCYWRLWVTKESKDADFADIDPHTRDASGTASSAASVYTSEEPDNAPGDLPQSVRRLHRRSLLVLRTQIDNEGAIIAANDFDIAHYGRDTYSYMWPRDGALVAAALVDAGYSEVTRRFFTFCHRVITEEGYLLHKFNPDGSLASSWHGWYYEGRKRLPVQEDETALVLWALWRHFQRFRDVEFIKPHYRGLIVRAANWLASYRDSETGLPLPSWDLWEERRGVLAWTVGATWAGLQAAANFAAAFGEDALAATYRRAAQEIRAGTDAYLWNSDSGCFARMINRQDDGDWNEDRTVDASLFGLWYFGMFAPDDPRIAATMQTVRDRLWVKTDVGGVARYENDGYHRVSQDTANVPGNPWFICTLWLAQWYIATAKSIAALEPAAEILNWAADHALPSGIMAEQVHPYTNAPLSVSPLTWSHATLVTTVHEYLARRAALI